MSLVKFVLPKFRRFQALAMVDVHYFDHVDDTRDFCCCNCTGYDCEGCPLQCYRRCLHCTAWNDRFPDENKKT